MCNKLVAYRSRLDVERCGMSQSVNDAVADARWSDGRGVNAKQWRSGECISRVCVPNRCAVGVVHRGSRIRDAGEVMRKPAGHAQARGRAQPRGA
eukprot:6954724-Prymnesium_polylepis.2